MKIAVTSASGKLGSAIVKQLIADIGKENVVLMFWKSLQDAEVSMRKFMTDKSVADYASLIDGPSLKMTRYTVDNTFNSGNSNFVEVMTFDTREEIDEQAFNAVNQLVANDFTAKQKGFLDRITGVDENGKQVVAVYWDTKKAPMPYSSP